MTSKYLLILGLFAGLQQATVGFQLETLNKKNANFTSGTINDFVDRAIKLAKPVILNIGFDPFKVDKIQHEFWFKPLFINYTGRIELENGWLQDLSTIKRLGDVKIKYEKKLLTFYIDLLVENLMADFDYKMKVFELGPSGTLSARIIKQYIKFGLQVDFDRLTFHLQQFALPSNGDVKLKITGLGLADIFINPVMNALTAIFRNSVTVTIGKQIRSMIEAILEKLPPLLPPLPEKPSVADYFSAFEAFLNQINDFSSEERERSHIM